MVSPFPVSMKFLVLYEKTASTVLPVGLLKWYSNAPRGRLDRSGSVATNGLQPIIFTSSGISLSASVSVAKGKRARNEASSKRGRP